MRLNFFFDIDGTLVSLDLVERFFCCDLDTCLGACCIEGDSGAPLTEAEYKQLKEKILGNLSEERFLKLSGKYEEEQFELKAKIENMKKIVADEQKHELNADGFLKIVRKYSEVEELTLDILQEFIDKIIIHHREEIMGETIQKIEIYYKMIGHIEIPHITKTEHQSLIRNFGRKKEERIA